MRRKAVFEISTGTGTIVVGLASVIIGTNIFKRTPLFRPNGYFKNGIVVKATTAVIAGSILYKACVAAALSLGLSPSNLKLITAVLFLIILIISNDRKRKVKSND